MICKKKIIFIFKINKPSHLWRKANQIKVDWRHFVRVINELYAILKKTDRKNNEIFTFNYFNFTNLLVFTTDQIIIC